jgi:hypothetical protein
LNIGEIERARLGEARYAERRLAAGIFSMKDAVLAVLEACSGQRDHSTLHAELIVAAGY